MALEKVWPTGAQNIFTKLTNSFMPDTQTMHRQPEWKALWAHPLWSPKAGPLRETLSPHSFCVLCSVDSAHLYSTQPPNTRVGGGGQTSPIHVPVSVFLGVTALSESALDYRVSLASVCLWRYQYPRLSLSHRNIASYFKYPPQAVSKGRTMKSKLVLSLKRTEIFKLGLESYAWHLLHDIK